MTDTQHTPGPWKEANYSAWRKDDAIIYDDVYAGEDKERGRICRIFFDGDGAVQRKNARLIASAPDLLEALIEMVKWKGDSDLGTIAESKAIALIDRLQSA